LPSPSTILPSAISIPVTTATLPSAVVFASNEESNAAIASFVYPL
jgi:hypothetical protein